MYIPPRTCCCVVRIRLSVLLCSLLQLGHVNRDGKMFKNAQDQVVYTMTKAAAAARPARAKEPVLALAAPVKVATEGFTGVELILDIAR